MRKFTPYILLAISIVIFWLGCVIPTVHKKLERTEQQRTSIEQRLDEIEEYLKRNIKYIKEQHNDSAGS
jgi:hypothetical protein